STANSNQLESFSPVQVKNFSGDATAWINKKFVTIESVSTLIGGIETSGTVAGTTTAETITGSSGADVINGGGTAADSIYGGAGNDTFAFNLVTDTLDGGDGSADTLAITSAFSGSVDALITNIEKITVTSSTALTVDLTAQTEGFKITASGAGGQSITGSAGADSIVGTAAADTLIGGAGDDTLIGGLGADNLAGGADTDVFVITPTDTGIDTITDFGYGADSFSGVYTSAGVLKVTMYDSSATALNLATVLASNGTVSITGGSAADTITGGSGVDIFTNLGTGDSVNGGTGADTFTFGSSAITSATIIGGTGADTVTGASAASNVITISDTDGISVTGGSVVDTLTFTSTLTATTITGGAGADVIYLNGVGNTVSILDATASITGSTGIDAITFLVAAPLTAVTVNSGAGNDTVTLPDSSNTATFTNVETINGAPATTNTSVQILTTTTAATITGGSASDSLTGSTGTDSLSGDSGNDSITAGSGNDSITGGAGIDSITSGDGNDVLIFATTDIDTTAGAVTDIITDFTTATDTIELGGSAGVAAAVEVATVTFSALTAGQTMILNGITVTAPTNGAGLSAATVAGIYDGNALSAASTDVATGTMSADYSTATASTNTVVFTYGTAFTPDTTNVANTGTGTATVTVTEGVTGVAEIATVTFEAMSAGNSLTFNGITVAVPAASSAGLSAATVAGIFDNNAASATPANVVSGTMSSTYSTGAASNDTVVFTYDTTFTNDTTNVANTGTGTAAVTVTEGVTGVAEIATVTFEAMSPGDSLTFNGITVTAPTNGAGLSATTVAGIFANNAASATPANVASGSLSPNWATGTATTDTVVFTYQNVGNQTDLTETGTGSAAITVTDGVTAVTGVAETFTATFYPPANGNTIIFDGYTKTYTLFFGAAISSAQAASYFVTGYTHTTWTAVYNSNGTATFTKNASGSVTDILTSDFTGTGTMFSVGTDTQGVDAVSAVTESASVQFAALTSGQTMVIDGVTITAPSGGLTATEVADLFESLSASGSPTDIVSGSMSATYTSGAQSGATVIFTAVATGVQSDLTDTGNGIASVSVDTQGVTAVTESASVAFSDLTSGQTVTLEGITVTAPSGGLTAAEVADRFENISASGSPTDIVSGSMSSIYASGAQNVSNAVIFTAGATGARSDLTDTGNGIASVSVDTQGVTAVTEKASVAFSALTSGQTVTLEGVTVTAPSGGLTATEVADLFESISPGGTPTDIVSGSMTSYVSGTASNATVVFTAAAVGNLTDLTETGTGSATISVVDGATGNYYEDSTSNYTLSTMLSAADSALDGTDLYYTGLVGGTSYLVHDEDGVGYTDVIQLVGTDLSEITVSDIV
ncbi:MAG: calcium-binding protein, partial [Methylococcales bacterium]|nr:calcium-binding protein [Methylococcales bacterium]